jgi:hypothetical protein
MHIGSVVRPNALRVSALMVVLVSAHLLNATTISFRETAGKNVRTISTLVTPTPAGFVVESIDTAYTVKTVVATDLTSVSWSFVGIKEKMNLSAEKTAQGIHVWGMLKDKKIDKIAKPGANPWWQETTLPLGKWALTGEKTITPCSVSMMNGDLVVFEVTNKGDESVVVDGRTIACVHVRMGLTGVWAMLWHGDYWFRKTDGRMIKYQGSGVPGYPPMSYEYLGEKE